jgi:hypothetical protein
VCVWPEPFCVFTSSFITPFLAILDPVHVIPLPCIFCWIDCLNRFSIAFGDNVIFEKQKQIWWMEFYLTLVCNTFQLLVLLLLWGRKSPSLPSLCILFMSPGNGPGIKSVKSLFHGEWGISGGCPLSTSCAGVSCTEAISQLSMLLGFEGSTPFPWLQTFPNISIKPLEWHSNILLAL